MSTRVYANKGVVDFTQYKRIQRGHWTYWSEFNQRQYELQLEQKQEGGYRWRCDCPDARKISHPAGRQCKHEIALAQLLKSRYEQKCMAEIEAEQILEQIQERKEQSEIEQLRAEIAALRVELETLRQAQASASVPEMAAIMAELAELREENAQIKRELKTKATARRKHQTETESAQIKEQINTALEDVMQQAENAIQAAQMAKAQLEDLEAIPHSLKAELDSWTEEGKEELQPDYKAPELPAEIKSAVREAQEADRKRREAPLNGNQGFSLLKK